MISTFGLSVLCAAQGFDHGAWHPRGAAMYIECPEVAAALSAYESVPAARMVSDAAVGETFDKVTKALGFDATSGVAALLAPLGFSSTSASGALGQLLERARTAQSFSMSLGMWEREPGETARELAALGAALASLDNIAERVEAHAAEHGAAPTELSALALPEALQRDPWGRAFVYARQEGKRFGLQTLGRDGKTGGQGADADLSFDTNLEPVIAAELERRIEALVVVRFVDDARAEAAANWMTALPGAAPTHLETPVGWRTCQSLQLAGANRPMWMAHGGAVVALGYGAATLAKADERARREAPSLDIASAWKELDKNCGAQRGAVVLRGWGDDAVVGGMSPTSEFFARTAIAGVLKQFDGVRGAWRMQIDKQRFSTDVLWNVERSKSLFGLIGAGPAPREAFGYVPSDAVGFFAVNIDSEALRARVAELFAGDDGADGKNKLSELEAEHGFNLEKDVCANLQGGSAAYLLPLTGIGLPNVSMIAALRDPAAFERGVRGLFKALGSVEGADYSVRESKYRDAPIWTVTFAAAQDAGPAAGFIPSPTLAIVKGRVIVSLTKLRANKEIKRALGEEDGPHPIASDTARFPADAGFSGWMDWATTLDGVYGMARSAVAMFGGQLSLPVDLGVVMTALPESSRTFTRFYEPTTLSVRAVEGGFVVRWDSSFGPETWLSLAGMVFGVSNTMNAQGASVAGDAPADDDASQGIEDAQAQARESTLGALRALNSRVVVFKLDQGRYPETLAELEKPTANYPRGFLEGLESTTDAWSVSLRYLRSADGASCRLWSNGPDGVDNDGAGDDILAP